MTTINIQIVLFICNFAIYYKIIPARRKIKIVIFIKSLGSFNFLMTSKHILDMGFKDSLMRIQLILLPTNLRPGHPKRLTF